MRIESISLLNIKAFATIDVPLGSLTLLSGLNGTGKSSVLQAFALLRQAADFGSLPMGEVGLNGSLVEIGTGRDLLHQGYERAEVEIAIKTAGSGKADALRWRAPVPANADVLALSLAPAIDAAAALSLFRPGFQFLRADRITPSATFPKSQHSVENQRFLGPRGEFTAHFLLRYGDSEVPEQRRSPEDRVSPTLLSQVNLWLQSFSPGVRVSAIAVPMTDLVRLEFAYRGEGVSYGEPLRPTNVGFGLTHVVPVIIACLAAAPDALITIENPEAQLHPKGQEAIGRLLALTAATGAQVVVETHSDHVLNGIRLMVKEGALKPESAKLHFFYRRPGAGAQFETPEVDGEGRLSFWPEGFFDQWERSLDALLS